MVLRAMGPGAGASCGQGDAPTGLLRGQRCGGSLPACRMMQCIGTDCARVAGRIFAAAPVSVMEAAKPNVHVAFERFTSGQLPFLGSFGPRFA